MDATRRTKAERDEIDRRFRETFPAFPVELLKTLNYDRRQEQLDRYRIAMDRAAEILAY